MSAPLKINFANTFKRDFNVYIFMRRGCNYILKIILSFCFYNIFFYHNAFNIRGIEWSLRAFASMRAVRFFLRARAVINFLMRAASTLEITSGEQRALRIRKFSASWNLSLLKRCLARTNLADFFKRGQKAQI